MVPEGWSLKTLEELARIERGKFSVRPRNDPKYYGGSMPFVQTGDISSAGTYLTTYSQTLNDEGVKISRVFPPNSILLTIAANIGETAITTFSVACPDSVVAIQAKLKHAHYFWLKLILEARRLELNRKSTQNAQKNINLQALRPLLIKTPPINEQQKIAQILSAWDKAIETTNKLIENSMALKKALMQQLFSDTKSNAGSEAKTAPFQIGELTSIYDGTHSTPHYVKEGVPFYSVEHLTRDNFSDTKFISEEVYKKENLRVKLEKGDILMTRIGDIGTPKYLDWDVQASFYVSLALIKQGTAFNSHYLSYYIQSDAFQRELWKKTIHVAFPKKINLGDLGKCIVFLPPIEEQKQIAQILSSVDQAIKAQEQKRDCLQKEKRSLMQQLLTGKRRVKVRNTKSTKAVA